jgi:tetratricopeptide (TPR) repeat protein
MPRFKVSVVIAAVLISLALAASASASELMAQAAALYAQRADAQKAQQAADLYDKALAADTKNEEAAWRKSQALYWVGTHLPESQQLAVLELAVEAAKQAVAINPQSLAGHYWLGVCYGVYGKAKGVMKSLSLVDPIKEEMAVVTKANPSYEDGGAYRVLGRLYFKLPGLAGGSNAKAVENLKKSVELGPQRWLNHLYLAEVYLATDKKAEAKELLQSIIAGPAQTGLEPEYADWKAEAEKMLKGL